MAMYDDIVAGRAKCKMRETYEAGKYGKYADDFDADYDKVLTMYATDMESLTEAERSKLYSRYLAVYRMAYEQGRIDDARKVLDSMAKLNAMTNVEVGMAEDGVIKISFGLGKKEEDD